MKKTTCLLAVICSVFFASATLAAADTPAKRFRESGKIMSFNKEASTLVVDDSGYSLSPTVRIYSPSGQVLSVGALQKGRNIKYNLKKPPGTKRAVIAEILVLPGK